MDRMIHTVLNSIQTAQDLRGISANNLANSNVPGYRRDLPPSGEARYLQTDEGFQARMFQTKAERGSFSTLEGFLDQTGDSMDISITGEGYFFVKEGNGDVGLSRRGDLRTDVNGDLMNGAGEYLLNANMQKINLPPFKSMTITEVGQIMIEPLEGEPGIKEEAGLIATTIPPAAMELQKGLDALIRPVTGPMPAPDQLAMVRQGVLEGSNVNTTEELINSIELQRNFEFNMRMVNTAKELDEAGAEAMRAPMA